MEHVKSIPTRDMLQVEAVDPKAYAAECVRFDAEEKREGFAEFQWEDVYVLTARFPLNQLERAKAWAQKHGQPDIGFSVHRVTWEPVEPHTPLIGWWDDVEVVYCE